MHTAIRFAHSFLGIISSTTPFTQVTGRQKCVQVYPGAGDVDVKREIRLALFTSRPTSIQLSHIN